MTPECDEGLATQSGGGPQIVFDSNIWPIIIYIMLKENMQSYEYQINAVVSGKYVFDSVLCSKSGWKPLLSNENL